MTSFYLRRAASPGELAGPLSPDQILEAAPSEDDCIALRADDVFVALNRDIDRNDALREALLHSFPTERSTRYTRMRFLLFAGLVPVLMLVAFDWDLLRMGHPGAGAALAVDVLSVLFVAIDVARPAPRHPYVTVATMCTTSLRIGLLVATRCGSGIHPLIPLFGVVALGTAATAWVAAPTPRAIADHLRQTLALAPPTRLPARTMRGFYRTIAYAIGAAALLPGMLWALRAFDTPVELQLLAFVSFAVVVPHVGRVFVGHEPTPLRDAVASAFGVSSERRIPSFATSRRALVRIAVAAIASLVLSFALVRGAQGLLELTARAEACFAGPDAGAPTLQRFIDAQRQEVEAERRPNEAPWLLLTILVVPMAEELVYRGLVQQALRRRLRRRLALGLTALLFGLAHLVVYRNAIYQPVLVGLSFGLAYERAGILASILAHLLWNLLLSI
jgi:membrane protease YdiL (CAAX protease family)